MDKKALVVFQGKEVRRTMFNEEWWFVAIDIINVLTNSTNPKGYLKDMKQCITEKIKILCLALLYLHLKKQKELLVLC